MARRASYTGRLSDRTDKAAKVTQIVQKTVLDIVAGAQRRSRVDTGQMRAGWTGRMTSEHEGRAENPVEHAIYNEYGTRHMSAQPMARPAADAARPGFVRAVRDAYND